MSPSASRCNSSPTFTPTIKHNAHKPTEAGCRLPGGIRFCVQMPSSNARRLMAASALSCSLAYACMSFSLGVACTSYIACSHLSRTACSNHYDNLSIRGCFAGSAQLRLQHDVASLMSLACALRMKAAYFFGNLWDSYKMKKLSFHWNSGGRKESCKAASPHLQARPCTRRARCRKLPQW